MTGYAEEKDNLNKLKETLDKSSQVNRTLGLSFAVFIFFIALTVASTTDLMLFIPDSGYSIPFFELQLNTVYFFIAIPFVILILHYNILFNLQQHSKKLWNWYSLQTKQNKEGQTVLVEKVPNDLELHPFLFNYAITLQNSIHAITLNIVIRITIFILPLGLLVYILFRFADYQSWPITIWHFITIMLDGALIATHSDWIMKIVRVNNIEEPQQYRIVHFFNFTNSKYWIVKAAKNTWKVFVKLFPALVALATSVIFLLATMLFGFVTRLRMWNKQWLQRIVHYQVRFFRCLLPEAIIVHTGVLLLLLFAVTMLRDTPFEHILKLSENSEQLLKTDSTKFRIKQSILKYADDYKPRLELREQTLVKSQPESGIMQLLLDKTYTEEERMQKEEELTLRFAQNYILKDRNFRFADFSQTILPKTDFRNADLTGANLEQANIQKANLYKANLTNTNLYMTNLTNSNLYNTNIQSADSLRFAILYGADLREAQLQGAILENVQLQGAILSDVKLQTAILDDAQLQGAVLRRAQLQGAYLSNTQLQEANLESAQLQGARLARTQLQGANLRGAQLQMAYLERAQFQGADLENTQLQSAYLWIAQLQGARLYRAQLQWAILIRARLQGADLTSAQLQEADLEDAQLQGADLTSSQLQGANLFNTQLQGAVLNGTQFQGAVLFGVQLQGAIMHKTELRGASTDSNSGPILIIEVAKETEDFKYNQYAKIAELIKDKVGKENFLDKIKLAQESFNKDTITNIEDRFPNEKIYRPKDLENDSTFFFIRREIASESKEIAQSMLKGTRPFKRSPEISPVFKSLYQDLYQYLKRNHPEYIEGFRWDEEGQPF
jgi:uncharacterized protein YjbI with pentapeptide repeats